MAALVDAIASDAPEGATLAVFAGLSKRITSAQRRAAFSNLVEKTNLKIVSTPRYTVHWTKLGEAGGRLKKAPQYSGARCSRSLSTWLFSPAGCAAVSRRKNLHPAWQPRHLAVVDERICERDGRGFKPAIGARLPAPSESRRWRGQNHCPQDRTRVARKRRAATGTPTPQVGTSGQNRGTLIDFRDFDRVSNCLWTTTPQTGGAEKGAALWIGFLAFCLLTGYPILPVDNFGISSVKIRKSALVVVTKCAFSRFLADST